MQKIRKGDKVVVLAGKDKGRTGEVLRGSAEGRHRAVVRGVNMVRRHQKQTQTQEGGIITKEAPIHLSNLALADPKEASRPASVSRSRRTARRCASPSVREMSSMAEAAIRRRVSKQGLRRDHPQGAAGSSSATRTRCRSRARQDRAQHGRRRSRRRFQEGRRSLPSDLALIAGQKPVITHARKSIAGFKVRENMPIGAKVTLRKERMYEFLDRLVNIALPRVRDFRGLNPKSFDGRGNYAMGIKEHIVFPEINYDKIDQIWGMDIIVCTTAKTDDEARALLKAFNFPFRQ